MFVNTMLKNTDNDSWVIQTQEMKRKLNITKEDMNLPTEAYKNKVQEKINLEVQNEIEEAKEKKSKVKYLLEGTSEWEVGTSKPYMKQLTRNECSIIFKARARMMNVMNNYKGKHKDIKCRICKEEDETQEHILSECKVLYESSLFTDNILEKVKKEELFTEDVNELKRVAQRIRKIIEVMESLCSSSAERKKGTGSSPTVGAGANPSTQLPLLSRLDDSQAH